MLLPAIIVSLLLVTKLRADVSEFFNNNLVIESPLGTLFPGEHAQFVCIAKNFEGDGKLVWHWHFTNRSTLYTIEPESDQLDRSNGDFLRRSVIRVPDSDSSRRIAYIGCEFSTEGHLYTKLMPLDILKTSSPTTFRNHQIIYPQIALEVYSSEIRKPDSDAPMTILNSSSYRHPAYLVTNKSISLSPDAKSIRLSCITPKHQHGEYRWVISTTGQTPTNDSKKQSANQLPSISLVLNRMSLIYREAVLAGRLPNCGDNTSDISRRQFPFLPYEDTVSDTIEILLSPLVLEAETLTYTCEPVNKTNNPQNTAYTKIMLLATRSGTQMQERDQEFLQLINILMQILQSSSGGGGANSEGGGSGGGGSGPIYGVGFGSSTIMILMGVTIFYLKRQLNQIQEQVREHDEERKKLNRSSRPVNENDSSEL